MLRADAEAVLGRLHRAQNRYYAGGDDTELCALLGPEVAWHVPGHNAIAGDYRGRDEVVDYMRRRRDLAGASLRMEPQELLVGDGDHVASRTDGTATIDGVEHRWGTVGLYRLRDGQVHECWLLPLEPETFDLIWSSR